MRPPVAPPPAWNFPQPAERTLANGMRVWLFDLPGQYVVSATLVIDLPLTLEPIDREGVATLVFRNLDEGTKSHPGEEFSELLEDRGAVFSGSCGLSATECSVDVPVGEFAAGLALFAEAVRTPAFEPSDVERHVALRLAEIEQTRANSSSLANVAFRATVLDPSARAARMNGGEEATVARVDAPAVREFHAAHYRPDVATLVVGGDLRGVDAWGAIEGAFGDWAARPGSITHLPPGPGPARSRLLHRPGSVQADLRLGGFGIGRTDPRWASLQVACYAMGGAFLSRLNRVLREERGYTYGISMSPQPLRESGYISVHGSFRTEVMAPALSEARELLDVSQRPFTSAEVTDAIAYLVGVAPLRYSTASGVVGQAATIAGVGLDPGYMDRSLAAVRGVTPDSATSAYLEVVGSAPTSIVVVGDAEQLAGPLGMEREELD